MSSIRLAFLALLLLAAGCTRLTAANYEKLAMGMSYAEVKVLFGEPTRCSDLLGAKHCVWGDERRNVTVNFLGDQVVLFTAENLR